MFGPLSAGLFMDWFGASGFVWFIVVILAALSGFTFWRIRIDLPVPESQKVDFVVTTRTSAAAADWDPRTPDHSAGAVQSDEAYDAQPTEPEPALESKAAN
jgi:hypothetical protein